MYSDATLQKKDNENIKDRPLRRIVRKRPIKISKKIWRIIIILIIIDLIKMMCFAGVKFYYDSHFLKGTTYFGTDLSKMTVDEANKAIAETISGFNLTIKGRDGKEETLTMEQLGMEPRDNPRLPDIIKDLRKSGPLTHFPTVWCDYEKYVNTIENIAFMDNANAESPKSTHIEDVDGRKAVVAQKAGTQVNTIKLRSELLGLIEPDGGERKGNMFAMKLRTNTLDMVLNLEEYGLYIEPAIEDEVALNLKADKWNRILDIDVTCRFGKKTEQIPMDEVCVETRKDVTISETEVRKVIRKWADKYNSKSNAKNLDIEKTLKNAEEALEMAFETGDSVSFQPVYG